jgi:hypothetical protein
MKINIQYGACALVLIAILAWTAVWYEGNDILNEASSRAATASSAQQQSDRAAYTQRLSAVVADTQADRTALENASNMNIVSIVTLIEGISTKTGITVKVDNATPQGTPVTLPNAGSLSEFSFVVEADGTFAQVIRTVQSLEALPLPSSVAQLELTRNAANNVSAGGWHLSTHLTVYTTSAAS